jgi:hypothetical protein
MAVAELGLTHVVVTSVTRDDLPDGGAARYARVVRCQPSMPGGQVGFWFPIFGLKISGRGRGSNPGICSQHEIMRLF